VSAEHTQSPVREGDIIAQKYQVEKVLGVGGMGVVVAARHVELGELFALKFLLPTVRDNEEVARRFAREARTGIRVKNEHVARVFDVGALPDGAPYMVMEHLTGEDLASIIDRRGHLPVDEAVDLLLQAGEALCEAHQLGIVHRDLKPANLFIIAGSDGLPFVKVLDFGISKTINTGEDLKATSSAAVLGSPVYMSPEQLLSSTDVDRRSDIWSLGVMLYEAVTGATPFNGTSFAALSVAILGGKFERASTLRPGLPPELDAIIASMLTVERADRLPSVDAVARRLAPLGTPQARTSRERIARIASRSASTVVGAGGPSPSMPSIELSVTTDLGDSPQTAQTVVRAPAPSETGARSFVESRSATPRPRRVSLVLGVGLAIALTVAIAGWAARERRSSDIATGPAAAGSTVVVAIAEDPSSAPAAPPPTATQTASSSAPTAESAASPHDRASAPSAHTPKAGGGSAAELLTRAFARREPDVAKCFDAQAADLQGTPKLAIRFTVDVTGHVKTAQIFPPEVEATPLGQCLAGVARGTHFGPQAEEVSFRIPIVTRRGS
jgi:eukaryotic-like serine/threonine-protein kinase